MFLRSSSLSLLLATSLAFAATPDPAFAPESWGEPVPEAAAVSLDAALATFDPANTAPGVYQGRIVDVCEQRGCWAMLELDGHAARVMPREHGFMLPRDLRGEAKVYGVLVSRDLSEASAKYAEEHPGERNPIPAQEYRIDALGIVMVE